MSVVRGKYELNTYISTESLDTEFKEFTLEISEGNDDTMRDTYKKSSFTPEFESLIISGISKNLQKYLSKYFGCLPNQDRKHLNRARLMIGVTDDGDISGIPIKQTRPETVANLLQKNIDHVINDILVFHPDNEGDVPIVHRKWTKSVTPHPDARRTFVSSIKGYVHVLKTDRTLFRLSSSGDVATKLTKKIYENEVRMIQNENDMDDYRWTLNFYEKLLHQWKSVYRIYHSSIDQIVQDRELLATLYDYIKSVPPVTVNPFPDAPNEVYRIYKDDGTDYIPMRRQVLIQHIKDYKDIHRRTDYKSKPLKPPVVQDKSPLFVRRITPMMYRWLINQPSVKYIMIEIQMDITDPLLVATRKDQRMHHSVRVLDKHHSPACV